MQTLSPKELMKSRYDAFVRKDSEYLNNTTTQTISSYQDTFDNVEWLKLDVIEAYENIVEFKAYYRENNQVDVLHEKSTFVLVNGDYMYDSGELFNSKIERNESCPCGSEKKFKKCCMKN